MNLLILGRGKIGSLVAEVARSRRHTVQVVGSSENSSCSALAPDKLSDIDMVIDFTAPSCVVGHIEACAKAGKSMVVGTTGWYEEAVRVREFVEKHGTGFLYGPNFSIGMSLFLDVVRTAAAALQHDYSGQIFERHHAHKRDAPSGTALVLRRVIRESSGKQEDIEIVSFREGEVVGMHEVLLESSADRIYLCHDAKSRHGFAQGAIRAAEWLADRKGFYEFKDIWHEL